MTRRCASEPRRRLARWRSWRRWARRPSSRLARLGACSATSISVIWCSASCYPGRGRLSPLTATGEAGHGGGANERCSGGSDETSRSSVPGRDFLDDRRPTRKLSQRLAGTRRKELCVEMEAAALFAVAKVRGLHVASAFAISDSLADLLWNPQLHGPEVQVGVIPLYEAAVTPCRQLSGTPGHCDWCRCHGTWAGNRRVASCRAGRLQLLARRSCAMRHRKKAYPRHSPASARCTACGPPRHERPLFAPVSLSG